jgi:tight adherence protein C
MTIAVLASAVLFVLLLAVIGYFGYVRFAKPGRVYEQLGGAVVIEHQVDMAVDQRGLPIRVLEMIGQSIPVSPEDATLARRQLMAAGFREASVIYVYFGLKVLSLAVFLIGAFLIRDSVTSSAVLRIVILVAGGLVGFFGPNFILDKLIDKRHEELRLSLPDALDLMVVCVEAGLGLDQAINNVSRELRITHPAISEELALVTLEMRAGKRRMEALKNLAERTAEPEIRKLVAILVQTDRFGTSMAESLRTHSDFMRIRRRQEAEERANKVGVKLVFPIFFFILPSMLVVAAGPGVLQIVKVMIPLMRQYRP